MHKTNTCYFFSFFLHLPLINTIHECSGRFTQSENMKVWLTDSLCVWPTVRHGKILEIPLYLKRSFISKVRFIAIYCQLQSKIYCHLKVWWDYKSINWQNQNCYSYIFYSMLNQANKTILFSNLLFQDVTKELMRTRQEMKQRWNQFWKRAAKKMGSFGWQNSVRFNTKSNF